MPVYPRSATGPWPAATLITVLALGVILAAPASAASPMACRVTNRDTGTTSATLQAAVDAARPGDRLTVRGTCGGPTIIGKSLSIRGARREASYTPILDGKLSGTVLKVKLGVSVTVRSLTIQFGGPDALGGGIHNRGTLALHDVVVRRNSSCQGAGVYNAHRGVLDLYGSTAISGNTAPDDLGWPCFGGGVYNDGGSVTLHDTSAIRGNIAFYSGGGVINHGTLVLNDAATIRGNTARVRGAGVANHEDGTVTMNGTSSIRGNTTAGPGGGLFLANGSLAMHDASSIHHNTAGEGGGGIHDWGATLVGVRCAPGAVDPNVHDNSAPDCQTTEP